MWREGARSPRSGLGGFGEGRAQAHGIPGEPPAQRPPTVAGLLRPLRGPLEVPVAEPTGGACARHGSRRDGRSPRCGVSRPCSVSSSAVSVQIQKLERPLGYALFDRSGRDLVLTEAGHVVLDHADAIFSIGEEPLGTLRESGKERTLLRVSAVATLSRNFQLRFHAPLFGRDDVATVVPSGGLDALLANHPLVRSARESGIRISFDAFLERIGLAVIPGIVVRDELASGELVEIAELPGLTETFWAITRSRRFPNPLLKDLLRAGRLGDGGVTG